MYIILALMKNFREVYFHKMVLHDNFNALVTILQSCFAQRQILVLWVLLRLELLITKILF